jgi:hypothetical protein
MKRVFGVGVLCAVLLLVSGCTSVKEVTSTVPLVYTNNINTKFAVLGEVRYESSDRIGYNEMLKAARKLYPDCDYVIDIMVDQTTVTTTTTTSLLFWSKQSTEIFSTYIMRGTAIKYVK